MAAILKAWNSHFTVSIRKTPTIFWSMLLNGDRRANALKETPPRKVSVKIENIYLETSLRPSSFEIMYEKIEKRNVWKNYKRKWEVEMVGTKIE
ncbi:hypothetical protein NQZ71_04095 [Niallia taxi]|uniref:hypothetical protein n=1 Tax=Niallia taxi TaxID=2499688 RepID=UPI0029342F2B|nr:hypothetical protein [Niallia taxi]WOD64752.1 hypothetical protein NQZ71_04095 [Niallia taxi]